MITVVGSLNSDLMVSVSQLPQIGETLLCTDFQTSFGGKGGNQAIAAKLLDVPVQFIGAVGDDDNGLRYVSHLQQHNIGVDTIEVIQNCPTGTAIVTLLANDNSIIVVPGANLELTAQHILNYESVIAASQFLLLQFEVSDEVIETTLMLAKKHNVAVILNPAPFRQFPLKWLQSVTYLTPNEIEFEQLQQNGLSIEAFKEKCIITCGKDGVRYFEANEWHQVKPPRVTVVDTTGAGDTFNGALAAYLAIGKSKQEAIRLAVVAASLSTQQKGAQAGMPTSEMITKFLGESTC